MEGIEDGNVCCALACDGVCGGVGCGEIAFTNGVDDCCSAVILASGADCSDIGSAPCIMDVSSYTRATTEADSTPGPSSGATLSPSSASTSTPIDKALTIATPSPTATPVPRTPTLSPVATPLPLWDITLSPAPTLASTAAPPATSGLSPAFTQTPSPAGMQATQSGSTSTSNSTLIVVGVASAVPAVALIALGLCSRKRQMAKDKKQIGRQTPPPVVVVDGDNESPSPHDHPSPPSVMYPHTVVAAAGDTISGGGRGAVSPPREALAEDIRGNTEPTTHAVNGGRGSGGGGVARAKEDADNGAEKPVLADTTSTTNTSTAGRDEIFHAHREASVPGALSVADEPNFSSGEVEASSSTGRRGSSGGLGLGHAVAEAAHDLALNCHIPGVAEVAAAVSILANLVTDNQDNAKKSTAASLKWCRSIVMLLQRAARVLGKAGDTHGEAERVLMGEVHEAISDLVELIKTYQSKNKLSQLLMSTLFRRRQDEMGAVVDRAISCVQFGLHVQAGDDIGTVRQDVSAVKQDVNAFKEGMNMYQESTTRIHSEALAETRRARRRRKLDQMEIPEEQVAITGELLGKGGIGQVYLADYNGRNAAAKVLRIDDNPERPGNDDVLDGSMGGLPNKQPAKSLRNAVMLELHTMVRLRNPYTVNVYGAITSRPDRLVLVMELLAGGDLRTLLTHYKQPLPDDQSRPIIGDICTGMAFLHRKKAVHGDLKSANVLLDGAGRAKIGDFGTSRWVQHTMSTGLATFTSNSSQNTQMSLAWSAPEVLQAAGSTYASDEYSFGIVVWEVISRELPWATAMNPRDIYVRVVLNDLRPTIPDDAQPDIADVARACWAGEPEDRPSFSAIAEGMKSNRWNV